MAVRVVHIAVQFLSLRLFGIQQQFCLCDKGNGSAPCIGVL